MTKLECDSKIAYDSPDHINPWGSKRDNSKSKMFMRKLFFLFWNRKNIPKILDLGCSGGGFIRDCTNNGYFGIGLEGSDYSKIRNRAEWVTIPDSLFTCDISRKFLLKDDKNKILKFDLITAWEFLEHIPKSRVSQVIKNIKKHINKEGIFIGSICNGSDKPEGIELHLTQENKEWWLNEFRKEGLYEKKEFYSFFGNQYVRGRNQTKREFNIIMGASKDKLPVPKLKFRHNLYDLWSGCGLQRLIKIIVMGEY